MTKKKVIMITIAITSLLCFGTYQIYQQLLPKEAVLPAKTTIAQSNNSKMEKQTDREARSLQQEPDEGIRENGNQQREVLEQEVENQQGEQTEIISRSGTDRQAAAKITKLTGLDAHSSGVVLQYAEKYNINPSLLLAIMRVESSFHQYAVGKSQDRGYFQIIPASEKAMADMFGSEIDVTYNPDRIFEPEYNIGLAAAYIHWLRDKYKGNMHRVLSEYNRGPGKLAAYYEENGTYETDYSRKVISTEKKYDKSLSY